MVTRYSPSADPTTERAVPGPRSGGRGGGRAADRKAKRRRDRRRRILLPVVGGLVVLLLAGGGGAWYLWNRIDGNLKTDKVNDKLNVDRPVATGGLNILLIGSDSRAGGNRSLGGGSRDAGERSDTVLLVHLAEGRKRAVVMSLPRDLLIPIPSCVRKDGSRTQPQAQGMFNSTYQTGGAACTRNAVEKFTGMRVDHHIILDFSGFKGMVDAVDGVEICVPKTVQDKGSNILIPAGRQTVKGKQALDYVRFRHDNNIGGDGSDLGRIKRQQAFVGSLAKKIKSDGTIGSPTKLFALADALTKSIRTDEDLDSVSDLIDLARSVQGMGTSDIVFATLPLYNPPEDKSRVKLVQPDAERLFLAVNQDLPIGKADKKSKGGEPPVAPEVNRTYTPTPTKPAQLDVHMTQQAPPPPPVNVATRDAEQDLCKVNN